MGSCVAGQALVANEELKWLSVKGNQLTSLEPLSEHGKLTVLNAAHNQLTEVSFLGDVRARWVTLRARWVTLRARWVTGRAS